MSGRSASKPISAGRDRTGFKTSREEGSFPGPVTDYALNVFLNARPTAFNATGYAIVGMTHGIDGDSAAGGWAARQNKFTIQGIQDGSSNTIMIAGKALPPAAKVVPSPKNCGEDEEDCPRPRCGGIRHRRRRRRHLLPGNWKLDGKSKKLTSTGTGRGHIVVKDPAKNPKENPKDGGVPWIYADSELAGKEPPAQWPTAWGSPFKAGLLCTFADGSVRMVKYSQKGTVNFARMLYPNDGAVVNFAD